ncbi:hypothetical protein T484DRAFT_1832391 [Baffinella frigidus]|nr:hypothetical protein T484DRAFT_1832391 [Cryptophyta sp. CCMP2293]
MERERLLKEETLRLSALVFKMEERASEDAAVIGAPGRDAALLGVLQDLEDLEARDREMQESFQRVQGELTALEASEEAVRSQLFDAELQLQQAHEQIAWLQQGGACQDRRGGGQDGDGWQHGDGGGPRQGGEREGGSRGGSEEGGERGVEEYKRDLLSVHALVEKLQGQYAVERQAAATEACRMQAIEAHLTDKA